jgi:heptaprenylglyceryl phosphate synthase
MNVIEELVKDGSKHLFVLIDSDKYEVNLEGFLTVSEIARKALEYGASALMVGGSTPTQEQTAMCWMAAKAQGFLQNKPVILFPHIAKDIEAISIEKRMEVMKPIIAEAKEHGLESIVVM